MRGKQKQETLEEIRRLYVDERLSCNQIAKLFKFSPNTVVYYLKKMKCYEYNDHGTRFIYKPNGAFYREVKDKVTKERIKEPTRVNDNLVMARLSKNMTQQQVADLAHINRGYYTKIENGDCDASLSVYRRLAIALGVSNWKDLIPKM